VTGTPVAEDVPAVNSSVPKNTGAVSVRLKLTVFGDPEARVSEGSLCIAASALLKHLISYKSFHQYESWGFPRLGAMGAFPVNACQT
jgi:hypothetical protein